MDEYVTYLLAFTVLVLIAAGVSMSYKYEHLNNTDHYGHDYDHDEVEILNGFERLRAVVSNLAGDLKIFTDRETTSAIKITDLNQRFAFLKAADYTNAPELQIRTTKGGSLDYGNGDPIILFENGTYYLSNRGTIFKEEYASNNSQNPFTPPGNVDTYEIGKNALITPKFMGNQQNTELNIFVMNTRWDGYNYVLVSDNFSVSLNGNIVTYNSEVSYDANSKINSVKTNKYLLFDIDGTKSAIYTPLDEPQVDTYVSINKIEYFGLTSGNLLPVPPYKNIILNSSASIGYKISNDTTISTLNLVPQVLNNSSLDAETMRLGLFAKVREGGDPGVVPGNFTGFNANTTNYKIIEYQNFSHESVIAVNDSVYQGLTTDGTPHYVIYVVPTSKDFVPTSIVCKSSVKNVQVVVLLTGELVRNDISTATVLDRADLTDTEPIQFKKDQYYYMYGKENILSLLFFKFNHTGNLNTYEATVGGGYTDTVVLPHISDIPNPGSGPVRNVSVVNYHDDALSPISPLNTNDYLNYYHYQGGEYTWKYRDETRNKWVNVND